MKSIWPRRRAFQALVLASLFAAPLLARYGHYLWARQTDKVIEAWEGSVAATALRGTDSVLRLGLPKEESGVKGRRPRKAVLERVTFFSGSVWSARLLGVSMTDLLAVAESAAASRGVRRVLLLGAVLPLVMTLLLGRVYCGWLCPMGLLLPLARRLRAALVWLELRPLDLKIGRGVKYVLLCAGLLIALATGLPVLQYLYPPALLGREAHGLVAVLFDRAEGGVFGLGWGAFSGASFFLLIVAGLEIAAAPGFWCASVCPGGALYSLLSRWRLLRVKRDARACTSCTLCDQACPMQLAPMTDKTGPECDACGVCKDVCPADALAFKWSRKESVAALLLLALLAVPAGAHHILGIPHYAYDESYPQAPVLKLVSNVGVWEVQFTAYPGNPQPGQRSEVHVYVSDPVTKELYERPLSLVVERVPAFGAREKVYGPEEGRRDRSLFKFIPTYPAVGNYELTLLIPDGDIVSTLQLPMVVGEPGSPWRALGTFGGAMAVFLVFVRAARIKRRRRLEGSAA